MHITNSFQREYFYSRASARRDIAADRAAEQQKISTHAPLRGATDLTVDVHAFVLISTHAPLRGATTTGCSAPTPSRHFYSRASARRDMTASVNFVSLVFLLTRLCEARRGSAS